jgi:hypothetical protein
MHDLIQMYFLHNLSKKIVIITINGKVVYMTQNISVFTRNIKG